MPFKTRRSTPSDPPSRAGTDRLKPAAGPESQALKWSRGAVAGSGSAPEKQGPSSLRE